MTMHDYLKEFMSPEGETSIFKGIPNTKHNLNALREYLGGMSAMHNGRVKYRIRGRGPRNGSWNERSHLPLAKAKTLTVYPCDKHGHVLY